MANEMLAGIEEQLSSEAAANVPAEFTAMLAEFAKLENERRELEAKLDVIETRARQLQEPILNAFADSGIQNMRVAGLTVYVALDRFCSKRSNVTTEQVCETLRKCGLGYMVSDGYNAASLKSKVKEWQDNDVEVPPALRDLLNIGEVARIKSRK